MVFLVYFSDCINSLELVAFYLTIGAGVSLLLHILPLYNVYISVFHTTKTEEQQERNGCDGKKEPFCTRESTLWRTETVE